MIPRKSSGSSLADSAVDPTRSQNMIVSWRLSAKSCGFGSVAALGSGVVGRASSAIAASTPRRPPPRKSQATVALLEAALAHFIAART
jgi:hypothetical protein